MGIISFIKELIVSVDQDKNLLDNINRLDALQNLNKNLDKEKCVSCDGLTPYTKNTHITARHYYVEGGGQLCKECYIEIYNNKKNKNYDKV